jgi:hypothetical protein
MQGHDRRTCPERVYAPPSLPLPVAPLVVCPVVKQDDSDVESVTSSADDFDSSGDEVDELAHAVVLSIWSQLSTTIVWEKLTSLIRSCPTTTTPCEVTSSSLHSSLPDGGRPSSTHFVSHVPLLGILRQGLPIQAFPRISDSASMRST